MAPDRWFNPDTGQVEPTNAAVVFSVPDVFAAAAKYPTVVGAALTQFLAAIAGLYPVFQGQQQLTDTNNLLANWTTELANGQGQLAQATAMLDSNAAKASNLSMAKARIDEAQPWVDRLTASAAALTAQIAEAEKALGA